MFTAAQLTGAKMWKQQMSINRWTDKEDVVYSHMHTHRHLHVHTHTHACTHVNRSIMSQLLTGAMSACPASP